MKKILVISLMLTVVSISNAQERLKKIKNINPSNGTFESYYVKKDSQDIRQGHYLYKYRGVKQIQGQFEDNYSTGEWIYTPGDNLRIVGNYNKGEKQGEWKYFKGNYLISVLPYNAGKLQGKSIGYYEDGQIACEVAYSDNKINGERKTYYENGQEKMISNYKDGKLDGTLRCFDKNGNLLYEMVYVQNTPFDLKVETSNKEDILVDGDLKKGTGQLIFYSKNKNSGKRTIKLSRTYKNRKLHGPVIGYSKGEILYRGQYMNGFMVGMWNFNLNDAENRKDQVYNYADSMLTDTTKWFLNFKDVTSELEEMPQFDSSDSNQFRYYISKSLKYPAEAQDKNISGTVIVNFNIDKVGLTKDIKIVKSIDKVLDEEAIRVIKSSPLWVPGFKDQLPVDIRYTFPIVFKL